MAAQAQPPPEPQLGKQASFLTDLDTIKPMLSLPLDGSGPQMSFSSNGSITTTTSAGLLTDKWDKYVIIAAARGSHSVQQKKALTVCSSDHKLPSLPLTTPPLPSCACPSCADIGFPPFAGWLVHRLQADVQRAFAKGDKAAHALRNVPRTMTEVLSTAPVPLDSTILEVTHTCTCTHDEEDAM
jgi:hypothetical protein